ncbi:3-deoxy-7-phosphoheptulonate synthase [Gandjariella thermophila]|nr:3-deoxy-7-phosphoheptulonate synthase [Gandjariella thermophila]
MRRWLSLPADQQPDWGDEWLVEKIRVDLADMPPLVRQSEVDALGRLLARVAAGELHVIQAGDCAEDPAECVPESLSAKIGMLDSLAGVMRINSGKPVLRVGRIAGQFAKPRSKPTERHGSVELPAFRGLLVNGPEPDPVSRRPDPLRMLACYQAAAAAMDFLRGQSVDPDLPQSPMVWTSHEALVLDYELPLVRRLPDGGMLLTSTHWPWIGERTRDPGGAHVDLLASVSNPVACKVGPQIRTADLLRLCRRLDPDRRPGRLTLIARLGPVAGERLPGLVAAVRAEGHPVIWMCDPMHGNTVAGPDGRKTRVLAAVLREVADFQRAVSAAGGVAGGLHLESTPMDVCECVPDDSQIGLVGDGRYTTLCDPRLNPEQAWAVAAAWCR